MTVERGVRMVFSVVVLATVAMSHPKCPLYVSEYMLFVTTAAAAMLLQSAFTGFCPMATILEKLGMKRAGSA